MADPFEVRMRFTNQLRQLSASVTSSQKAAQYALRHKDLAEDLHSCILEQLERVCLYFIFMFVQSINHFGEVELSWCQTIQPPPHRLIPPSFPTARWLTQDNH